MKQIQPVSIWVNGATIQANWILVQCINDNLTSEAVFLYQLFNELTDNNAITKGNLYMTGTDYNNYESNQDAFNWVAAQLNIIYA